MRILLIAGLPDSILSFRGALIEAMQAAGHDVHVAAPDIPGNSWIRSELESRGVRAHDIPLKRTQTNPLSDVMLCWRLFRLMRALRPDCVLSYTIKPVIYGSLAAWLSRVPRRFALVTGLGYAFTGTSRGVLNRLIERLYSLALGKVHKVFFQNPDDQALLVQLGVLRALDRSIVVNGSGVDVTAFLPSALPEGPPRFLLIGRLLGNKGVREYVSAARRVRAMHPSVHFGLVGWIDENPDSIAASELERWISDGDVEFYGRLSDVRPAIADCTVYVLPSYREGTPRSVLEAMAMARPVITTDAPGCRETVKDGENGLLVPVKSVDELVLAMLRFIEEPGLASRMGSCSRRLIEEKYDVRKVNSVMMREMGLVKPAETKVMLHG